MTSLAAPGTAGEGTVAAAACRQWRILVPLPRPGCALGGAVTPKSYDGRARLRRRRASFAPAVGVTQTKEAHHDETQIPQQE